MNPIEVQGATVRMRVRVQPNASRNLVRGEANGQIRIALTAPPVEGAANKALIAFVAKSLGIAKRNIIISKGETSREKTLSIQQCPITQVLSCFTEKA